MDQAALIRYLTKIAPYVERPPVDARPVVLAQYVHNPVETRSDNTPVPIKILPSRDGAALQVNDAAAAIMQSLASNPLEPHVILPLRTDSAKVTEQDLAGVDARIAHFVTHFNTGERGRTQTVRRAIGLIDGHVVKPGDVFSVNQTVGERTQQRGFGQGIVFIEGHLDTQFGGGMCQVATTLFNAVL